LLSDVMFLYIDLCITTVIAILSKLSVSSQLTYLPSQPAQLTHLTRCSLIIYSTLRLELGLESER